MIELLPDECFLVGFLPSYIEIPCQQGNHSVLLTRQTLHHVRERRDNEHPDHLALVLSRLSWVVAHPSHFGSLSREPHKLDLWAWHPDDFSGGTGEPEVPGWRDLGQHSLPARFEVVAEAREER